jgi:hypothetical protein
MPDKLARGYLMTRSRLAGSRESAKFRGSAIWGAIEAVD